MSFVTIINTPDSFKIGIIRNLFEMEDIQYRLLDEFMNSAAGIGGLGINGMRIQVLKEDFMRAQTILDKTDIE